MLRQAERPSSNKLSSALVKAVAWQPALAKQKGTTKHAALTERIIADINCGVLKPMDRMPTHRDLARELGISAQTVSLSYKEAERLGYLSGEVGRGTFVKSRVSEQAGRLMLDRSPTEVVDLSCGVSISRRMRQPRAKRWRRWPRTTTVSSCGLAVRSPASTAIARPPATGMHRSA